MAVTRQRRTQAERSAGTRAALLDATIGSLVERGYAATTTTEVTRRADVSPGALLHHFPTKTDLLCAAVAHLLELRQAEFRKAMANLDTSTDVLDAAIDQLWSGYAGPAFEAWLELWVAARSDDEVGNAVRAMERAFATESAAIFEELFPSDRYPDEQFLRLGLRFALTLMDGVALRRLVVDDDGQELIDALKVIARQVVADAAARRHD